MANELLFDGSSEDATANIKRLVIEFASTLPADVWPNSYMASEVKGRWQYLTDLDGRKSGRIVLEVTGDFLMTDEERQARLSHIPESIQTWDGNNWVATHPGVVGRAFNWKSLGEIEILRMNERRSRIINSMNSPGNDVWQYVSNELSRMGLLVSLSTSTTTTEQTLSAAATPQPTGINFSNINVGGNFTVNQSDVAGGNQTTTTTTTITQQPSSTPAAANPSNTPPFTMTPAQFNELLREQFNESELKDICLALNIDYESLAGNSKADKTRELILYLQRRGRVPHLLTLVKQERPHTPWPDTIQ